MSTSKWAIVNVHERWRAAEAGPRPKLSTIFEVSSHDELSCYQPSAPPELCKGMTKSSDKEKTERARKGRSSGSF